MPERPLDGVSLQSLIDGTMTERASPICFWSYDNPQGDPEPYIDPKLQEGTTPLVKLMDGRATRSFVNFHHRQITEGDFFGPRAILDNRYKLVVDGEPGSESVVELFDLRSDRAEAENLVGTQPETAQRLQQQLRAWQQSVLESLTGSDYS
jgi:arylsulfatase A-like enzyme